MSRNSRGARFGALASASEASLRRRPPNETALIVLQVIFCGATAALFFAWLTSAGAGLRASGGLSAQADCVSFGKGGVRCLDPSGGDGESNKAADSRRDCLSLGRGGLLCDRVVK